ncbi:hypothetical protein ACWKSP_38760 [Micromonosporaceae bacterium Da 78-11]
MTTTLPVVHRHRPLLVLTGITAVLTVVAAVGVFADPRILTGAPIWLKPFKFGISFTVYALTLAWMISVLPRRSRVAIWAGTTIVAMSVLELGIVVVQVIRGTTSHYNETSPLNAALWQAMGSSILVLFLAHLVIAVVALRQRIPDRVAASAIRWGLGLSLLGMAVAMPMVQPGQAPDVEGITGAHSVGVPDGGPGLPLTGWSTVGGDLRIGHFVGMHALQAMPLLAILLGRVLGRRLDESTQRRLLLVAGPAYGVLVVLLTWQAMRGQPLLRPDALTLGAVAALAAVTAVAAVTVVRRGGKSELALAA